MSRDVVPLLVFAPGLAVDVYQGIVLRIVARRQRREISASPVIGIVLYMMGAAIVAVGWSARLAAVLLFLSTAMNVALFHRFWGVLLKIVCGGPPR